jgi:uncharacterized membrane protein
MECNQSEEEYDKKKIKASVGKLILEIIIALILNIIASYYILPKLVDISWKSRNYYNINDFYVAIIIGIILLIIELMGVFLFIWLVLPD